MLTVNKKSAKYFSTKMSLFGNKKELQSDIWNYGEPHASLLNQRRGTSFTEGKRKMVRVITNKESLLLCFVIHVGYESSSFLPPYFTLNEFLLTNFLHFSLLIKWNLIFLWKQCWLRVRYFSVLLAFCSSMPRKTYPGCHVPCQREKAQIRNISWPHLSHREE